jgi:hypothetical protein
MIPKSFGLLFYLKKPRGYAEGERPIYLRITIDSVSKEMSIQRSWDPDQWKPDAGRAIVRKNKAKAFEKKELLQENEVLRPPGNCDPDDQARALNAYLDTLQAKVHEARHQLLMSSKPITAESVRNIVQGREASGERPHLLLEIFQYHNDQVKALIGVEYAKGTLTKFVTVLNHTRGFLQWKYKTDDLDIRKLDYEFITELEFWYKSVQRCDHNTTMKYIACIKKMAIHALRNGWLQRDPFLGFNMALREVEREALNEEELQRMAEKEFVTERLEQVRDIFLFSCFTGLAYADLQKLNRSEISTGVDGAKWIFTRRQKTDTPSRIPILPMAMEILERYADHPNVGYRIRFFRS